MSATSSGWSVSARISCSSSVASPPGGSAPCRRTASASRSSPASIELVPPLDQSVGVEQQDRARLDRGGSLGVRRAVRPRRARCRSPAPSRNSARPSEKQQRRRVPGPGPADDPALAGRRPGRRPWTPWPPGSRAANRSSSSSASAGLAARQQRGRQRAAQLAHDRGGRRTLADDVADGDRDPVVVQLDDVVPVTAGLGARGAGQVARGEGEPVQVGQPLRQQAALQRLGDPLLGAVEARAVQRLGALLGEGEQGGALDRR